VVGAGKGPEERAREKLGAGTYESSITDAAIEHADEFHRFESLTERGASYAELLTKLPFRGKTISGLPCSLDHILDKLLKGSLCEGRSWKSSHRFERTRH